MLSAVDALDTVGLTLPPDAVLIADTQRGVPVERRWFCGGGLYVTLAAVPAARPAEVDPLSLDLVVGETLERYVLSNRAVVESMVQHPFEGALAGRMSRSRLVSSGGEPLVLFLSAALLSSRVVVVLQVVMASGAEEHLRPAALSLIDSFEPV